MVRFSPDDRLLVTCSRDHVIRFWRTTDGKLERALDAPKSEGHVAAISPDVSTAIWYRVVAGESNDALEWLDLKSGKIMAEPHTPITEKLVQTEFSPDGSRLALGYGMGQVTVLNGRSRQVVSATIKHTGNLEWVEWSPDGRRLLTAGNKEEILVWDAETGAQLLAPLRIPGGAVRVAHWSPDGRFIIGLSDKRQARVWDAATGEAVTPLLKHSGDIRFAFMTRNQRLITASSPDRLRAWDLNQTPLPPEVLADYARLLSGRRFNAQGVLLPLKPTELAELSRSLHTHAPQLFE
jgi:WD40 repeat protein